MDFSSVTLQSSSSFTVRAPTLAARAPSLSFTRNSARIPFCSSSRLEGGRLVINSQRFQLSTAIAAVVGDKTTAPSDCSGEESSVSNELERFDEKRDEEDGIEGLDDHKMTRVCDKLIEVFMVDKPAPTDWRRLLAFSKEWDHIRPHFYKRCQERADSEDDPGMKHKLLRLARKLKEVDGDVQRHNELLQVIRQSSSEISEVVARRRKDFTKEFFVHLHTVAESYYNNPTEQDDHEI